MMFPSFLVIVSSSILLTVSIDSDCHDGACTPLSTTEKQAILDLHNELRDRVAGGGMIDDGHPMATDMNYLIWDEGLQTVAQTYAETCPGLNHNDDRNFQIKYQRDNENTKWGTKNGKTLPASSSSCGSSETCISIGENLLVYGASYDINSILSQIETGWWDEYTIWTYGPSSFGCNPNEDHTMCGHYTQMAWANTRYVGCGYANGCSSGWSSIFVCNYFPVGNVNGGSTSPYTSGGESNSCTNCMSDRTECKSMYVSRSITAASYPNQPYNALCDGGACPTMCAGDSWSAASCDECTPTPLNIDCNDGTIAIDDGRNICSWTGAPTLPTQPPTTATPTTVTQVPTPSPTGVCGVVIESFDVNSGVFNGEWLEDGVSNGKAYYTRNGYYLDWILDAYWAISNVLGSTSVYGYCQKTDLMSCTTNSWYYSDGGWVLDSDAIASACSTDPPVPTVAPTKQPTGVPTKYPTSNPSKSPSKYPTISPSKYPSSAPIQNPSQSPTTHPITTQAPTIIPSKYPTNVPTKFPSKYPTINPSESPSKFPTSVPTKVPSKYPTDNPSKYPSFVPTQNPSHSPTDPITKAPTIIPSKPPTTIPSELPTDNPSAFPTSNPSMSPSSNPSKYPTTNPSTFPTNNPSKYPSTQNPTQPPTLYPTALITGIPTTAPTKLPTSFPTNQPTKPPTSFPTNQPTNFPSNLETGNPTAHPTTTSPTSVPSQWPTSNPVSVPTEQPTANPIPSPTQNPSTSPTLDPSREPSLHPTTTSDPSVTPTRSPILNPTSSPTHMPHPAPTISPTMIPTAGPIKQPSPSPTQHPTSNPIKTPTSNPSLVPTSSAPTMRPSAQPTLKPTTTPTANPLPSPTSIPTVLSDSPTSTVEPTRAPTEQPTSGGPTCDPITDWSKNWRRINSWNEATDASARLTLAEQSFSNSGSACEYEEYFYQFSYKSSKKRLTCRLHVCCGVSGGVSETFGSGYSKDGYKPNTAYTDKYGAAALIQTEWTDSQEFGVKQYVMFAIFPLMVIACCCAIIYGVIRRNRSKRPTVASKSIGNNLAKTIQMHAFSGSKHVAIPSTDKMHTDAGMGFSLKPKLLGLNVVKSTSFDSPQFQSCSGINVKNKSIDLKAPPLFSAHRVPQVSTSMDKQIAELDDEDVLKAFNEDIL